MNKIMIICTITFLTLIQTVSICFSAPKYHRPPKQIEYAYPKDLWNINALEIQKVNQPWFVYANRKGVPLYRSKEFIDNNEVRKSDFLEIFYVITKSNLKIEIYSKKKKRTYWADIRNFLIFPRAIRVKPQDTAILGDKKKQIPKVYQKRGSQIFHKAITVNRLMEQGFTPIIPKKTPFQDDQAVDNSRKIGIRSVVYT